ncbi:uncharacterized protein RHIMIDRAFT_238821 [Rhizopus microsporus ATCC 52813]|uniref:Transcription initiation factor TFIID subunit 4 n=1 Tax=Rhizopus microsporus ATCC 52813 TaxID=1340429 RepID=A0A2G4SRH8_RHIZD|nr:uncharacterized protein RHIMIDRAFT_238821 [Rhizopus microsporus ATCC 52813]PHZ11388.1 hypothetical protein RHIMIDRAFT_238821 [Rhizopus microsporus ATCC 52813]
MAEGGHNGQQQQHHQQQPQNLGPEDLNFSINDILNGNSVVNDSSFQTIVQTFSDTSNNQDMMPSFAHLPAELQDFFSSSETDDLLSTQNASIPHDLLFNADHTQPFVQQPLKIQTNPTGSPQSQQTAIPRALPQQQQPHQQQPPQQQLATHSPQSHVLPPGPVPQVLAQPIQPSQSAAPSLPQQASSTTLLDNITSQLPPDRKEKFMQLFRDLQTSTISAAEFMAQAKAILGQQQYQQLEDLKTKPMINHHQMQPQQQQQMMEEDQRKRKLNPASNITSPQIKKPKSEHIPMNAINQQMTYPMMTPPRVPTSQPPSILPQQQQQQYPIQPNIVTPSLVKPPTPAGPQQPQQQSPFKAMDAAVLQIPTKSNIAVPSTSKPPGTAAPTPTSTGGGGDRVDYEALTDVMGYAGVDLKEEAEHFMKEDASGTVLPDGIDRSKFQDFMNPAMLRDRILKYAKSANIKKIDGDFISYLALATQDRIRTVMENMVRASRHRTENPFKKPPEQDNHPLYKIHVKQKVKDQLKAIERADESKAKVDEEMDDVLNSEKGWYSKKSKVPLKAESIERKITVQDAIFVMERDVQGGRGTNRRTLLKAYNILG